MIPAFCIFGTIAGLLLFFSGMAAGDSSAPEGLEILLGGGAFLVGLLAFFILVIGVSEDNMNAGICKATCTAAEDVYVKAHNERCLCETAWQEPLHELYAN